MYHTIWSYLWDLVEDGIHDSVRFLSNEIGLDAISVATAYHTFQQLRPHRQGRKLLTSDCASVYFQPDETLYGDTVIRPHVAPLAHQSNPLAQLAQACATEQVDLISWTVCLHNSHLATTYPELAQETAYGDRLGWILCPGCDHVRAYVVALCRDLVENYGCRRIELETCNFGGYGHSHYHVKDGVDLGAVGRYLHGLSFSQGCCERARDRGIDVVSLRQWVRDQLDGVFAGGPPLEGDVEAVVSDHPELAAFQELREELVTSLVGEVKEACGDAETSLILMGDRWTAGLSPGKLRSSTDLFESLAYTDCPDDIEARVTAAAEPIGGPDRLVLGLQAYPPCARDMDTLKANVDRGAALGVSQFSYYNYGIMPRPSLQWVSHCIRST